MTKQLSVRFFGEPIGILEQDISGKMSFTYEKNASHTLSIGMPLRKESFNAIQCEAFFGGLLPESTEVRKAIANRFGVSPNNSFALLKAIGYDCAGAISFHSMNESIVPNLFTPLKVKFPSENKIYEHIKDLDKNPLFIGFEGLRLSLAGVQDKAAVCVIDNKIALPIEGCPTTHILKPFIPRFEGIVENEYFCLKVAADIGLTAPKVEIRQIKDIKFLLVKRYDRIIKDNLIQRVHQEDFCQALGIVSSKKYQNEGGPSFKNCFDLLNFTTIPAIERNTLVSVLIFNYLIGNTDAHGKNFSLLYKKKENIGMAPIYDILCTTIYDNLSKNMAMKIGNQYEINRISERHFEQLCKEIDYSYPALKILIKKQGEALMKALDLEKARMIESNQYHRVIDKIINFSQKQFTRVMKEFEL